MTHPFLSRRLPSPDPPPDPPSIADGRERALDPRVVPMQRTVGAIAAAVGATGTFFVFVGGSMVAWFGGDLPLWAALGVLAAWLGAVGALAWLVYRWPAIAYRHVSYRLDEQGLEIRRGVFWRTVVNVPRSRVQHTDVSQGPLERGHGLGTLVVYTAGTDHARVDLGGLEHALALEIREHLLPLGEGSDAV